MAYRTAFRLLQTVCIAVGLCACGCKSLTINKPTSLPFTSDLSSSAAVLDSQLSLGRIAERRSDFERAKQIYRKVLDASPNSVEALHRLGVIYAQEGNLDESLASLTLANATPSGDVLADIGYAYYLKGDLAKAEQALRKSLQHDPQNKRAVNNLAIVVGNKGDYDESLALFRRSNPPAKAHANLAYVLMQKGDLQSAANAYHRALDYDRDLKLAAHALVQLNDHLPIDLPPTNDAFSRSSPTQLASFARDATENRDNAMRIPASAISVEASVESRATLASRQPVLATTEDASPSIPSADANSSHLAPGAIEAFDPSHRHLDQEDRLATSSETEPSAPSKIRVARMPDFAIPTARFPGVTAQSTPPTSSVDKEDQSDASPANLFARVAKQGTDTKQAPPKPPTQSQLAKVTTTDTKDTKAESVEPTKQADSMVHPIVQIGPYDEVDAASESVTSEADLVRSVQQGGGPQSDLESELAPPPPNSNEGESLVQQGFYSVP